ncbi:hypothetical protein CHS0354_022841 [Potamilus streckersoni]|uniref:Uncharacterized protein n=1 Tax=Potamilus streckersoni TaxID=2493646 RepID=A0AAE0S1Y0_9BIVA|nr:hypothetical protein CHS0354_022841 [Potamilus streckersoni]
MVSSPHQYNHLYSYKGDILPKFFLVQHVCPIWTWKSTAYYPTCVPNMDMEIHSLLSNMCAQYGHGNPQLTIQHVCPIWTWKSTAYYPTCVPNMDMEIHSLLKEAACSSFLTKNCQRMRKDY